LYHFLALTLNFFIGIRGAAELLERWFKAGTALLARLRASGRVMPIKDSLIAATAIVHDLVVATHNRADFEKAGVAVFDPLDW
jgi:predicted nucleic acid-binding protein